MNIKLLIQEIFLVILIDLDMIYKDRN